MSQWSERWQQSKTAWDLGAAHPLTLQMLREAQELVKTPLAGHWMIPGCGRAHDIVALQEAGIKNVLGVDIVPLAIDEAKRLYGERPGASFVCRDILKVPTEEVGQFAGIFDRAMMCAVTGRERKAYMDAVGEYLGNGGLFVSLAFASVAKPESGPPFEISKSELMTSFGAGWDVLLIEDVISPACDQKILKEWRFIARKLPV
jgi:SAM-dependent methyltransferase